MNGWAAARRQSGTCGLLLLGQRHFKSPLAVSGRRGMIALRSRELGMSPPLHLGDEWELIAAGQGDDMAPKRKQPAAAASATKPATKRRSKLAKENDLTAEEEAEIQEAYALFAHRNEDNLIQRTDVRRCLIALNAPPADQAELRELLETVDPEETGFVDYEHFLAIAALKLHARHDDPGVQDEEMRKAYHLFTKGEEREITLHDLRRVARELREDVPENVLKDMVREATGGGLGGVGMDDFEGVMKRAGVFG